LGVTGYSLTPTKNDNAKGQGDQI